MSEDRNKRKAGILTHRDRTFLTGENPYEGKHAKQQRYDRREEIRRRVHNALLDFELLYEHLDETELEKLAQCADYTEDYSQAQSGLYHGVRFALQFLYKLTLKRRDMTFGGQVADAVVVAERDLNDRFVDPRFYLNPEQKTVVGRHAAEKFREGQIDDLTVAEMRAFLSQYRGSLDPERPGHYARWRYGTSREPPKKGEEPFEEWLAREHREGGEE